MIDSNDPTFRDTLLGITGGRAVDVIFDPVGSRFRENVMRTIGWRGRILIVGFAGGEIPQIPAHYILNKFCSICGVWWGRSYFEKEPELYRANLLQLVAMYRGGTIKPHLSRICNLETASLVLADLIENRINGRAVIALSTT